MIGKDSGTAFFRDPGPSLTNVEKGKLGSLRKEHRSLPGKASHHLVRLGQSRASKKHLYVFIFQTDFKEDKI